MFLLDAAYVLSDVVAVTVHYCFASASARRVLQNRQLRTGEAVNEKALVVKVADIVAEILQVRGRFSGHSNGRLSWLHQLFSLTST